jgi:hypothetical protein
VVAPEAPIAWRSTFFWTRRSDDHCGGDVVR